MNELWVHYLISFFQQCSVGAVFIPILQTSKTNPWSYTASWLAKPWLIPGLFGDKEPALNHRARFHDPSNDVNSVKNNDLNELILSFLNTFPCLSVLDCSTSLLNLHAWTWRAWMLSSSSLSICPLFPPKWCYAVHVLRWTCWVVRHTGLHPSRVMVSYLTHFPVQPLSWLGPESPWLPILSPLYYHYTLVGKDLGEVALAGKGVNSENNSLQRMTSYSRVGTGHYLSPSVSPSSLGGT